ARSQQEKARRQGSKKVIPDIPILRRPITRSGTADALYDPQTLTLRVDNTDKVEHHSSLVHEWVHWYQHHGTSFGAFLSALRFSQRATTVAHLRNVPRARRVDIFRKKNAGTGGPIVQIDNETQALVESRDDSLGLFRHIWYSQQFVHGVL